VEAGSQRSRETQAREGEKKASRKAWRRRFAIRYPAACQHERKFRAAANPLGPVDCPQFLQTEAFDSTPSGNAAKRAALPSAGGVSPPPPPPQDEACEVCLHRTTRMGGFVNVVLFT